MDAILWEQRLKWHAWIFERRYDCIAIYRGENVSGLNRCLLLRSHCLFICRFVNLSMSLLDLSLTNSLFVWFYYKFVYLIYLHLHLLVYQHHNQSYPFFLCFYRFLSISRWLCLLLSFILYFCLFLSLCPNWVHTLAVIWSVRVPFSTTCLLRLVAHKKKSPYLLPHPDPIFIPFTPCYPIFLRPTPISSATRKEFHLACPIHKNTASGSPPTTIKVCPTCKSLLWYDIMCISTYIYFHPC